MRDALKAPLLIAAVAILLGMGSAYLLNEHNRILIQLQAPNVAAPVFPLPGLNVSGTEWINSPPLTLEGLRGKVVLVEFWQYTDINSIRTFPAVKRWYDWYHRYGFEVIGVHTPEFDIGANVDNVRAAVKRFGLPYPIVVDNRSNIWNSYNNGAWPGFYLIDADGVIRYSRLGEGADEAIEHSIRKLLIRAYPGLKFPSSDRIPSDVNASGRGCGVPTKEMYVGTVYNRGSLANPQGYQEGETINYKLPPKVEDGETIVGGFWMTDPNGMVFKGKSQEPGSDAARMEIRYHARELYSVINVSHGKPSPVYIQQDGHWLTQRNKGIDVRFDSQGRSYIPIDLSRLYYLVTNPQFGNHIVTLFPTAPGATVNEFSFSNNCQLNFPHR